MYYRLQSDWKACRILSTTTGRKWIESEEHGYGFFKRIGLVKYDGLKIVKQMGGRQLRKACVRLSLSTHTSIDHFLQLDIYELSEVAEEVQEVRKKDGQK